MVEANSNPKPDADDGRKPKPSVPDGRAQPPGDDAADADQPLDNPTLAELQPEFGPIEGLDAGEVREPIPIWSSDEITTDAVAAQEKLDAEPPAKVARISFLRLALILVVFGVAAFGVHKLHSRQLGTMAATLREQADRARDQGRQDLYVRYLQQYIGYAGQDADALAELASVIAAQADTRKQKARLYLVLERVCRIDSKRHESRRQLVEVAMDLDRYTDALAHIELLNEELPGDGELNLLAGQCYEQQEDYATAIREYRTSIELLPEQLESYERLAGLLAREPGGDEQIADILDQMVVANRQSAQALITRSRFRLQAGDTNGAAEDVRTARELAPDLLAVHLLATKLAVVRTVTDFQELERVYASLKRLVESDTSDLRLYQSLAALDMKIGRTEQARDWLQRGLELQPDSYEARLQLITLLAEQGRFDEAEDQIQLLASAKATAESIRNAGACFEGYVLLHNSDWYRAAQTLENVLPLLSAEPLLRKWTNSWLAQCYREIGDRSSEIEALRSVLDDEPSSIVARRALAHALAMAGNPDDALGHLLMHRDDPGVALEVAQLIFRRNLLLPPAARNRDEVDRALALAEEAVSSSPQLVVLRARITEAWSGAEQAVDELEDAIAQSPDEMQYRLALALIALRNGKNNLARETLKSAKRRFPDDSRIDAALIEYWSWQDPESAAAPLTSIENDLADRPPTERRRLAAQLARVWLARDEHQRAETLWRQLADQQPADLKLQLLAFESALNADNPSAAEELLARIQSIEGPGGPYSVACRVAELLKLHESDESVETSEVRVELQRLRELRPNWHVTAALEGRVLEFEGQDRRAVEAWTLALENGSRDAAILARLVKLLWRMDRYSEANQLLKRFEPQSDARSSRIEPALASELAYRAGDIDRALAQARRWVRSDPDSADAWLSIGRLLAIRGDNDSARKAFEEAVSQRPDDPEAWIALLRFYVRTGSPEESADAAQRALEVVSADDAPLVFGYYYESTGDEDRARENYQTALDRGRDDPATLRAVSDYYLRNGENQSAIPLLREIIEIETRRRREAAITMSTDGFQVERQRSMADLSGVRRDLAAALAASGYQGALEALALLDADATQTAGSETMLTKARILAAWPRGDNRAAAIEVLSRLDQQDRLPADDALLLTRLMEAAGDDREAVEKRWDSMGSAYADHPRILIAVAHHRLDAEQTEQAGELLRRAQALDESGDLVRPLAIRTLAIESGTAAVRDELQDWDCRRRIACGPVGADRPQRGAVRSHGPTPAEIRQVHPGPVAK